MKKTLLILTALTTLSACTTLTRQENIQLQQLKSHGITLDKPVGHFGIVRRTQNVFLLF